MSNNIEDIENVNFLIRTLKADNYNQAFINSLKYILADRERLEKENEELLEVKISSSANNRIEELERENFRLKTELENKRKEYQDTYKDVREELKELNTKANKYDSLIEKIKGKKEELQKLNKILIIVLEFILYKIALNFKHQFYKNY